MRGGAQQWLQPRGGAPPEGEKGGAGRPGSRPLASDLSAGHEERPARPSPTAARRLDGLSTLPCGVSENDFAAIRTPLSSSVRRGSPRLRPRQVRGWRSGAPALGRSIRHAGRGIGLRPPAPALRRGPAGEPQSHLRGLDIMPHVAGPSHRLPTYIMNRYSLSPPICLHVG